MVARQNDHHTTAAAPTHRLERCQTCGKTEEEAASGELKRCAVCTSVAYCCIDCQKADWVKHKPICTEIGCKLLLKAIGDDDATEVRRLASSNRILNGQINIDDRLKKWAPIHECIRKQKTNMLSILLEYKPKINIKDGDGEPPIFIASTCHNATIVKLLLDAGANPNYTAHDGWSCLMMSTRDGDYDVTKALLDAGASIHNGSDMFNRTCIDMIDFMAMGHGVRMRDGETYEQAQKKYHKIQKLIHRYNKKSEQRR